MSFENSEIFKINRQAKKKTNPFGITEDSLVDQLILLIFKQIKSIY